MVGLDRKDCAILGILQKNCRATLSDIGQAVDLSPDSVRRRIDKMVENKIFHPKVQMRPPHFGYPNVIEVKIKLKDHSNEKYDQFIAYLQDHSRIVEIFKVSGPWDLSIVVISKDAADLRSISDEVKGRFGGIISEWIESMTLDSYKFELYDMMKLMEEESAGPEVVIIDYKLGNVTSVLNALKVLGVKAEITNDVMKIRKAKKIILPGVGAFAEGMKNLKEVGLIKVLYEEVLVKKKPFLGICLGMQIICTKGYEGGEFKGLGWIDAEVVRFEGENLRIPHIGWNDVKCNLACPILSNGKDVQTFYFVHSYFVKPKDSSIIVGSCDYGIPFAAVIQKENIFATQFHPEKSQHEGLEILRKFATLENVKETTDTVLVS